MNRLKLLTSTTALLFLFSPAPLFNAAAQTVDVDIEDAAEDVETSTLFEDPNEIIVTGRKREESVIDVPVAISVLQADIIAEQNVLSQQDLAELVPGLNFNNSTNVNLDDRLYGTPSIRGVGSSGGVNTAKVTSFLDGMPILGSTGAINIGGATQVEVYNGPQSAAFGRSTFGGAINYVTRDPGDEIEGSVGINWSDTGTRVISGNVGGPIIDDILGFQLGANFEDSTSEDPDLYSYTDGIEANTRGGLNLSGRLVYTPTDKLKAKLTFTKDTTDDGPASSNFYATQESARECFDSLETYTYFASGMGGQVGERLGVRGEFDCDLEVDRRAQPLGLHDINRYFNQNPAAFDAAVQDLLAQVPAAEYTQEDIEQIIVDLSTIYSIPHGEAGTEIDRDRIYGQLEYLFDNGSLIQFSAMKSEEESFRQGLRDYVSEPYSFSYTPATPEVTAMGMTTPAQPASFSYDFMGRIAETSDASYEEEYYEVRYASPAANRLRYLVGASLYKYDYLSEVYRNTGFQAVEQGLEDRLLELTGDTVEPGTTFATFTENKAAFFNLSYDFNEKLTGSFEGRYAADKIGTYDPTQPDLAAATNTFESFTPRVALTYNPNEETSLYLQYAIGVSPGGINSDLFDPEIRATLDNGIPVANVPEDTANGVVTTFDYSDPTTYTRQVLANFDSERYATYDEETLTNYEFGFKGSLFDNRLTYSGAIFHMLWEDEVQTFNINWEHPYADDTRVGQAVETADLVTEYNLIPVYVPTTAENTGDAEETTARVFGNTGDTETSGIELQGNFTINDNWSVSASGNYMNVRYADFCDFALFTGVNDPNDPNSPDDAGSLAGLAVEVDEFGNDCYQLEGQTVEREPSVSFNLSPRFRTEVNGFGINATARLQYTGEQYLDSTNFLKAPGSFRTNVTLGLTKDNWSANFYVQNLFDDTSVNNANLAQLANFLDDYPDFPINEDLIINALNTDYATYQFRPATGRTFGARLNYRF